MKIKRFAPKYLSEISIARKFELLYKYVFKGADIILFIKIQHGLLHVTEPTFLQEIVVISD